MAKRHSVLILFFVLFSNVFFGQASKVMTNTEIIKLHKSKLSDKVIISKIQSSSVNFDMSSDALIVLAQNGVSEDVINAMMDKQTKQEESSADLKGANGVPGKYVFPRSGIYFEKDENVYSELDPTLVTSTKDDGNCLGNCLMTYGIGAKENVSSIEGAEANYQLNSKPVIYFCFAKTKKELGKSKSNQEENYFDRLLGDQTAVSPNEFKLIKLKVKGNSRTYVSGTVKASTGSVDVSIGDEYIVNFKYAQVAENTYELSFPTPLEPGEYCFYYLSNSGTNPYSMGGYEQIKVYDFSVK